MKRAKFQDMAVKQLVERFTAIGIEQDQALIRCQHAKFNKLFDEMVAIEDELKARKAISGESCFHCTLIPMHRSD